MSERWFENSSGELSATKDKKIGKFIARFPQFTWASKTSQHWIEGTAKTKAWNDSLWDKKTETTIKLI